MKHIQGFTKKPLDAATPVECLCRIALAVAAAMVDKFK